LQCAAVFRHARAFHHEGCERPRRTGETEQRGFVAEFFAQNSQRLVHIAQSLDNAFDGKFFDVRLGRHGKIHLHTARFLEMIRLSHRLGNHEDVAEQNRGIKAETPPGLQGDFDGELRILHELDEGISLLELAIFGQRAASLTHEPQRRSVHRQAARGAIEAFARGQNIFYRRRFWFHDIHRLMLRPAV